VVASKHSLGTTTESEETQSVDVFAKVEEDLGKLSFSEKKSDKKSKGKQKNGKEDKPEHEDREDEEGQSRQHAEVGREWLHRTLRKSGKTEADLASVLWQKNMTAVLEVSCQRPNPRTPH
jgi:hypothetical protein